MRPSCKRAEKNIGDSGRTVTRKLGITQPYVSIVSELCGKREKRKKFGRNSEGMEKAGQCLKYITHPVFEFNVDALIQQLEQLRRIVILRSVQKLMVRTRMLDEDE